MSDVSEPVLYERDGHVATITYNRPEALNAIDAPRAHEMGLVWRVVPHDDLMREAHTLAARLCRAAPLAARAVKEVAWRSRYMGWTEAVRFGETMRRVAGASEDAREGGTARAEGREPRWRAR